MPNEQSNLEGENPEEEAKSSNKLSRLITVTSSFLVGAVLLIVVGTTLFTWAKEISWVSNEGKTIDYPVKGENLVIADVETFFVKEGSNYLPVSKLKLHKKTTSGNLRGLFVNERDRMVGKPFSIEFVDGKFSGEKGITLKAKEGIEEEGLLNAYLTGQTEYWHLTISEGPSGSTSSVDFKEILRVPVSRKLIN